jgi:hypothetical protein
MLQTKDGESTVFSRCRVLRPQGIGFDGVVVHKTGLKRDVQRT